MSEKAASRSRSTVLWWIGWMLLAIGSFFVACFFWTPFIAEHVGSVKQEGVTILWVTAVFGTWMIFLLPLIVVMYRKVDKAYEDARIRRELAQIEKAGREKESAPPSFRIQWVDPERRLLAGKLQAKVRRFPKAIRGGHLVTALLPDGRRVEHVYIADGKEVLGVYGLERLNFEIRDIVDLEPTDLHRLPDYQEEEWLRLDGLLRPET